MGCLLGLAAPAAAETAEALAGFEAFVAEIMAEWQVPGLAVAAVKDGEVVLQGTYGLRDAELGLPVTPRTLFAVGSVTKTLTATGLAMLVEEGRLDWDRPLRDATILDGRYQAVEELAESGAHRDSRECLAGVGDLERILSRIALKSARPRDLSQLRDSLERLPRLGAILSNTKSDLLRSLRDLAGEHPDTRELLERAIIETPPILIRDGGVIATGYDDGTDEVDITYSAASAATDHSNADQ